MVDDLDLPPRRVTKSEPVPPRRGVVNPAASVAKGAAEARAEQTRFQQPPTPPPPSKQPDGPGPAELTRPAFGRDERSRPSMPPAKPADRSRPGFSPVNRNERSRPGVTPVSRGDRSRPAMPKAPPEPDPVEQPTQVAKALDKDWAPTWESGVNRISPVQDPPPAATNGGNGHQPPPRPVEPEPLPVARREPPKPVAPPREPEQSSNPTLPEEAQQLIRNWHNRGWTPMGRLGTPADIGDVVVLLCSEKARWITGQVIYADGGASLMNPEVPPEIQIG